MSFVKILIKTGESKGLIRQLNDLCEQFPNCFRQENADEDSITTMYYVRIDCIDFDAPISSWVSGITD
jgi:hypothetical protein